MSNIKTFTVDFDSLEDCNKLLNTLKSNMGNLRSAVGGITRKDIFKSKFDACNNIFETDISSVYSNIKTDNDNHYYVYVHCDPGANIAVGKDGITTFGATLGMSKIPFYIGKGKGNRAFELDRNETHRKVRQKLKTFGNDIHVQIIKSNLTEKEALMYESKLIDIFGLRTCGGKLVNLDEGVNSSERRLLYAKDLHTISDFYKQSIKGLT